jgi:geranylgeranylglycerol-phosphate geranylgeranyltransferase
MILLPFIVTILYTGVNAFFIPPILHKTSFSNSIKNFTNSSMSYRLNCIAISDTDTENGSNKIVERKIHSFLKLIRAQSILPTTALCITGGLLIKPSFIELLKIREFWISTINTLLLMSSSMIINDMFDRNVDIINHPHRPLVNGEVTMLEAGIYSVIMLSISKISSFLYLPIQSQRIIDIVYGIIFLYTPIFKKIPIVKNLVCSGLVAFSVLFSGLSVIKDIRIQPKMDILFISTSFIFLGSLYNELLLDMRDIEGDKENGIYTIPVFIGNRSAWFIANRIVYSNIIINTLAVHFLYKSYMNILLPIFFTPLLYHLYEIKKYNFSKKTITQALKHTNATLFGILTFLCFMRYYN